MLIKLYRYFKQRQIASQLRKPRGAAGKLTGSMMNKANAFLYRSVIDIINLKDQDHLLEIGFGNGHFFSSFFEKIPGICITGIDYSSKMVKEAKRNNHSYIENGKLNIIQGESNNLPFQSNTFDAVFCINVIYFWKDPGRHLQEICRVLKPGGSFYAIFRTKESMQLMPFTRFGFTGYDKEEWISLLNENRFANTSYRYIEEPEVPFKGQLLRIQSHCISGTKPL